MNRRRVLDEKESERDDDDGAGAGAGAGRTNTDREIVKSKTNKRQKKSMRSKLIYSVN